MGGCIDVRMDGCVAINHTLWMGIHPYIPYWYYYGPMLWIGIIMALLVVWLLAIFFIQPSSHAGLLAINGKCALWVLGWLRMAIDTLLGRCYVICRHATFRNSVLLKLFHFISPLPLYVGHKSAYI